MTAPTVTPEQIEASIKSEHYFTAYEGVMGDRFHHDGDDDADQPLVPDALRLMTICILVMQNDFTVIGTSACASPERYNKEIGQRIAREKAIEGIWPLLGYQLRSQLHAVYLGEGDKITGLSLSTLPQASAPAKGGEADRQAEGHDAVGTGTAEADLIENLHKLPSSDENFIVEKRVITPEMGDIAGSTSDPFGSEDDN